MKEYIPELYVSGNSLNYYRNKAPSLKSYNLNLRQTCDLDLILDGSFYPLKGSLTKKEYLSVCENIHLPSGELWPIPINLDVSEEFADTLTLIFPNTDIVVILLGYASAIIDNVPLVAASMGMFSQEINNPLWHFIAFSAGTGGSMLIIGSAAGVVAMGMEKIDFFWYLKKISWLALIGFLSGAFTFIVIRDFIY